MSDFSVGPHILHISATWKRQTHHFSLEVQEDQRPKYNKFIVTIHEVFFGFIRRQHRMFQYSWFVILSCKHYVLKSHMAFTVLKAESW